MTTQSVATKNSLTVRVLGSRAVFGVARRAFSDLRVLAYHEVADEEVFSDQMRVLRSSFSPVDAEQVAAWCNEGRPLPDRAVWVTFDDGHPSVFERAAPVLEDHDIQATAFICSAVIDTNEPYWWQVLERAASLGLLEGQLSDIRLEMKSAPDAQRRSRIEQLRAQLTARAHDQFAPQATTEALQGWTAAGHTLGNHSHDHPMLDRCRVDTATEQIRMADALLRRLDPRGPRLFAYPNGAWTSAVEGELRRLDYEVAVLFDHRLVSQGADPLRLSRLRVDADAPLDRFRAIVSGVHSSAFHRLRRTRSDT